LLLEPRRRFTNRGRKIATVPQVNDPGIEAVLKLFHFAPVAFFQRHEV